VNRILYEEAAKDLRTHNETTGERDVAKATGHLAHADACFFLRRPASIGPADANRQAEGATNGTLKGELDVLGRMFGLAHANGKLIRPPLIHRLKRAAPRAGFFKRSQLDAVKRQLGPALQVAVRIAYAFGWRMQREVLTLQRHQMDLNSCTLRLEPGTTKNDEGRLVYLTTELVEMPRARDERVQLLEITTGKKVLDLFPYLDGEHEGKRIQDFRNGWWTARREAIPEGLEGGRVRSERPNWTPIRIKGS
jgi:integrase